MPVPTPNKGESQADFVARCMKFLIGENPNRDQKQALAICYSQWRGKESMHPDFERVRKTFLHQFGDVEGPLKFEAFVEKNKLDVQKKYHPDIQFKESFGWVDPLISRYKEDSQAKYYLVRALTANVSMKNADWSDYAKMQKAAETLSWRPVNLNHDHSTWFSFPRTRVDFTKADDFSVEATLRVDNADRGLQEMLDSGKIMNPSIEARPNVDGGYQFTAMALVEAGVDLPGDPCTEIMPLMFNESIGKAVCKLINGKVICGCVETQNTEVKNMTETINKKIEVESPVKEEVKPVVEDPTVKLTETIAKYADVMAQLGTAQKRITTFETETIKKDHDFAELSEKAATLMRENTKIEIQKKQIETLTESLVTAKSENNILRGKEEAESLENAKHIAKENKLLAQINTLEESIGKSDAEKGTLRRELNEESTKRASAEQKALNETKECSRVKLENAGLLDAQAVYIKKEGVWSEQLSSSAKRTVEAEKKLTESMGEKQKLEEAVQEKDSLIKRAELLNKKAHKLFEQHGIYEVDKAGELKNPVPA